MSVALKKGLLSLRLRLRLGPLRYVSGNWCGRYAKHVEMAFGYAPKELVYEVPDELITDGCLARTVGAKGGMMYRISHPDHVADRVADAVQGHKWNC